MKKKISICMLHSIIHNEHDMYRYLQLHNIDSLPFEFVWDEKQPDYLIATEEIYTESVLWGEFVKLYPLAKVNIYRSLECTVADLNMFDYAIVFDKYLKCGDRVGRTPTRLFFEELIFKKRNDWAVVEKKDINAAIDERKFCNFIYSNDLGHGNRKKMFETLSTYKRVDSWGKYLHNVEESMKESYNAEIGFAPLIRECIDVKSNYKFSIAFENAMYNGYTSEKIFSSLEAHTVPIYWGNPLIEEEVNPKAFVNCHNFDTFDEVLEEIKRIDNDDKLWLEMVSSPWMTQEQEKQEEKEIKEYYDFLENIFMQPIERARRRADGFHPERYQKWFFQTQANNVKYQCYHEVESKWIEYLRCGKDVKEYFVKNGYKTVVIYGLAQLGLELFYQLENKRDIEVLYGIDQGNPNIPSGMKCYKLCDVTGKDSPDVIVITVPHLYEQIKGDLEQVYNCPIIPLIEIVTKEGERR